MYSRPKRAAALAAVAAINDEQKTEKRQRTENADDSDSDNGDYDPSVPLIFQSDNHKQNEPTLRDLIQGVHSKENSWMDVTKRLDSHPSEATPRDFHSALLVHFPLVPEYIIAKFIRSGDVIRWEAFRFITTCPWFPIHLIRHLLVIEEDEIHDMAEDHEDIFDRYTPPGARLNRLFSYCSKIFGLFRNPSAEVPPRIEVIKEILKPSFALLVLSTRDEGRCVPMHNVCDFESNIEYVRLLANVGKQGDQDTSEDTELNPSYGGLLQRDTYGRTPLWKIAHNWSDEKAADITQELFDLFHIPSEIFPDDILNQAISEQKWELCKVIIHKLPRTLLHHGSAGNHPLHEVVFKGRYSNLPLALLMVEQTLRLGTTVIEASKNTCGLLTKRNWANRSPLKTLFLSNNSSLSNNETKVMDFCKDVIKYIVLGMEANENEEDGYNLLALMKEAVHIRFWAIIQYFIENFPAQLHLKDEEGCLLLHHICRSSHTPMELIQLAITTGLQQHVGGKNGRGGLAIANNDKRTALEILGSRNAGSNNKLFKNLMEATHPKLIVQRDFKSLNLLHAVADGGKVTVARQILKSRPECISFVDDNGRLPLHIACMHKSSTAQTKLIRLLLSEGVKQHIDGKGGLLLADDNNKSPLDHLLCKLQWDGLDRWKSINELFEGVVDDVPLIQSAIEISCYNIPSLVHKHRDSLKIKDEFGCFPLHVYLAKQGSLPDKTYKQIFDLYPAAANEPDGDTGLLPYQTAATLPNWKLKDVYDLLRTNPCVINLSLDQGPS